MKKKHKKHSKKRTIKKKSNSTISDKELKKYNDKIRKIRAELSRVVVGQEEVVDGFIRALIANGHVLVEGVPGIAKTLIVRTLAIITGCKFGRVQFTVDLLPSDILGITTLAPDQKSYEILKGPVFNNFLIADEVNRAPPKTQSALLESMGELQVSISKHTFKLDKPFFVMATQNPIESSGTYPLPEAQVDRFLFKLLIDYPLIEHEEKIIEQNISLKRFESYEVKKIIGPQDLLKMQELVQKISHNERINKYIVSLVDATRNPKKYDIKTGDYIQLGGSPRASIFLFIAAKADAFLKGQKYVTPQNVKNIAFDVLRHRIMLNYKAQVDNIKTVDVIKEVLAKVRIP